MTTTIAPGTRIDHFVVEAHLGAGGLGVVYLAEDLKLKRKVALKFLNPSTTPDQTAVRRLVREAQIAGALDHPNIGAVHEIGEWQSTPFIAMAYCAGATIKERLGAGPLPLTDVVSILGQMARGLAHAHAAGVVHRDLKPANVMLGPDGHVRILDFGIARLSSIDGPTATNLTADGSTLGTVAYMAPEQVRGEPVDAAADVSARGVTLYERRTGVLPFRGATVVSTMHAILEDTPVPVRQLRADVPRWLESIVEAALQKPRAARTLTAADIVRLIDEHRVEQTGAVAPVRGGMSSQRRFGLMAGITAIVAAVAFGGWTYVHRTALARTARERDLPELARLVEQEQFYAAFDLARGIEPYVGREPEWLRLFEAASRTIDIDSAPDGATVSYRPYGKKDEVWRRLGQTPIRKLSLPRALAEWKIEKDGYVPAEDVGLLSRYITLLRRGSPPTSRTCSCSIRRTAALQAWCARRRADCSCSPSRDWSTSRPSSCRTSGSIAPK